ncbi:exporter of the RND superfamily protein-like protein [Planctopirus limnophila DSM 3776]|uniref:Exporter of the RND superfamily protein-like protein n=1 Tax=Planctopirus limnophila (strain ATCC 43296 / DSM 3776 / IFAM 1008 / Mu 290) TaxID=521674 RepID=D5ST96_PLAL2|nr:MMPL family transporter [Planctopirus limnophila]ADG66864.1 exporter of the RND superfamily protein-like protein [Planctopirus limnophila DSM 3776]
MISTLYARYYKHMLWFVALTLPLFWYQAESIKSNNDIETWMPRDTGVRQIYEQFKLDFGAEEVILIGASAKELSNDAIEALAGRLERLPGIRSCWTPGRLAYRMEALGVSPEEAHARLEGLLTNPDKDMVGLSAVLSEAGTKDRAGTVAQVREVLKYCQLNSAHVALTGAPVIVTELDTLGNAKSGRKFFAITLAICLGLLYFSLRHWNLSLGILGVTLWGIFLTQSIIAWCGGEMNFILGSLSVLVMIFTLSIAVHFVSYYSDAVASGEAKPLDHAFKASFNPCFLSTLTTLLGLVSLNVSSILPVAQFGYAAATGAVVAMVVGLGLTPALLMVWPDCAVKSFRIHHVDFDWWGHFVNRHRHGILAVATVMLCVAMVGIVRLRPDVDPVDFLPRDSQVLVDLGRVEKKLTNVDSIEGVVDFTGKNLTFVDQLQIVRELEAVLRQQPGVRHVLSLATFFPNELPDGALATARMFSTARSYQGEDGLIAADQQLWRVSIRVEDNAIVGGGADRVLHSIQQKTAGFPVHFTGMTPLLDSAQKEIFSGFWESFTAAVLTISLVFLISLRSFVGTLIAMVPNIVPIWLVFGSVGFFGMPVDIGMMMTGSIALGISVDCTFHFMVQYNQAVKLGATPSEAVRIALQHSGEPMLDSTLISSTGMLALCLSSFAPTARFGCLMSAQMIASILGELVFLPALLCCLPEKRKATNTSAASEESAESSATPGDLAHDEIEPQIHRLPAPAPHIGHIGRGAKAPRRADSSFLN